MTEISPMISLPELLAAVRGQLVNGALDIVFQGVSTDSRTVSPGNLFIALPGDNYDGHNFLGAAIEKGAAGLLISREESSQFPASLAVIHVDETLAALGDIARFWRSKFHVPVVAITGSTGKTTTKEMLASILGITKNVLKTEGNYNNLIGLPLTLLRMESRHDIAVVELGTNQRGEIARLTAIARPDVGIITNIGHAHLEGLKSLEIIAEEKGDLFQKMADTGVAVINADDDAVSRISQGWRGKRVSFGIARPADVRAEDIEQMGDEGIHFTLSTSSSSHEITMNVLGMHNVYNALSAAAVALTLGVDGSTIVSGLESFVPVSGRMEITKLANGSFVIDDTYNANPLSVQEALKTLKALRGNHHSFVVLGDMLELGDQAKSLHESVGELLTATGVEHVFLKGDYASATTAGAVRNGMSGKAISCFDSEGEVIEHLRLALREGDWILVKGSRRMRMELVTRGIINKFGHKQDS